MNQSGEDRPKKNLWNVPNRISMARLFLSVALFVTIPIGWYWASLVIFVVAASTDWVDGWYARKYQQVTKLGRMLDPICDKVLICGAFILIAVAMRDGFPWYAKISGWVAVIVVSRELLVTVIRSLIEGSGGDFSAKMAGKLKMWFQSIAVGACLVALALKTDNLAIDDYSIPGWLNWTIIVSVWIAVISTVHSGYLYVVAATKMIDLTSA